MFNRCLCGHAARPQMALLHRLCWPECCSLHGTQRRPLPFAVRFCRMLARGALGSRRADRRLPSDALGGRANASRRAPSTTGECLSPVTRNVPPFQLHAPHISQDANMLGIARRTAAQVLVSATFR
jgi:hypothetical protein